MTDRDRLIKLLEDFDRTYDCFRVKCENIADHLIANGVIVPPCKVGSVGKLTDNEIIKALKCCMDDSADICKECPIYGKCVNGETDAFKLAYDLIIRLQEKVKKCEKVEHFADKTIATLQADVENYKQIAEHQQRVTLGKYFEIKELKAENERLSKLADLRKQDNEDTCKLLIEAENKLKTAKAEAVKEFAERLKARFLNKNEVINNTINNLLKEMVGDGK